MSYSCRPFWPRSSVTLSSAAVLATLVILGGSGCGKPSTANSARQPDQSAAWAAPVPIPEPTLASTASPASGWREFRNPQGQTIRARMVDLVGDRLSIEREDGRIFTSPLHYYSEPDQLYVKRTKVDRVLAPYIASMQIKPEHRKHTTRRDVLDSMLGLKESIRDVYKDHIARHGSMVGCRTLVVGQEPREHYAATLKDIEDLRSVLHFTEILNTPLDG